jgi:hypothetical protein
MNPSSGAPPRKDASGGAPRQEFPAEMKKESFLQAEDPNLGWGGRGPSPLALGQIYTLVVTLSIGWQIELLVHPKVHESRFGNSICRIANMF